MNKQRKTSHILNVFQYDADGHVGLPASLTLGIAPTGEDNSGKVPTTAWVRSIVGGAVTAYAPTSRTLTINGTSYDLSSNRAWSIDTGVMTATAGSGISVSVVNQNLNIVNTGILTASSGAGISLSVVNQNLNVVNTGILTASAGLGISLSVVGQNLNVVNTGILTASAGSGISLSVVGQNLNVVNTGILTATAGAGISVSVVNGNLNVVNTITNNNQLTNGAGYITSSALTGYATETYVGTAISNLVDAAPGTLDTLNELAAALGDDPNFATTIATSIGTKQAQLNGTGFVKISGTTILYDNSTYLTTSSAASTYVALAGSYANPAWITSLAYSKITGVPAFITSYTETDTLATVTARGASTSTALTISGVVISTSGSHGYVRPAASNGSLLLGDDSGSATRGIVVNNNGGAVISTAASGQVILDTQISGTSVLRVNGNQTVTILGNTVYHAGNLTNLNQLSNGPGYITGYTETDTLATVTSRGATTTTQIISTSSAGDGSIISRNDGSGASWRGRIGHWNATADKSVWLATYNGFAVVGAHNNALNAWADLLVNCVNNNGDGGTTRLSSSSFVGSNAILHAGNYTSYTYSTTDADGRFLRGTTNPGSVNNFTISIGNNGSYSYVQSHSGQPLELNPVGNTVRIAGNIALHAGNYTSYSPSLTGSGASGTWGIRITGFANQGTARLYSTDSAYNYDAANPYFGYLTYDGTRWLFQVSPGTPAAVRVSYADSAGSASSASTSSQVSINYNNDSNANYQLLWGSGNSVYGTGSVYVNPSSDTIYAVSYRGSGNVGGTGEASNHPAGIYSQGTNWLYGTVYMNNNAIRDVQEVFNNGWFRTVNHQGLYNPTNDAHFYPNNASYGSWRIDGSRNGWHGLHFASGPTLMMNSNETGVHRESYGWQWRWDNGTFYVHGNSYGGGTGYAVIHAGNIGSQSVSYASSAGSAYSATILAGIGISTIRGGISSNNYDFYVNGDANTYYPVVLSLGGQYGMHRYSISRGYSDPAPWDPIGTGSHRGGLTLTFDCSSDIAWGGNDKSWRIIQFAEQYTNMVAGMALPVTDGIIVWLRGGGAYYRFHGPSGINHGATVYYSGYTGANGAFYGVRTNLNSVDGEIRAKWPIRGYGDGDMYVNNQTVIHTGNVGSQSVSYASNSGSLGGYSSGTYLGKFGNGNGYYQSDNWIQVNGSHGIFWPSYYSLHIRPNISSSYTQMEIIGSKNSYGGIYDNHSAVNGMMYDGGGNGGVYREASSGRWYWYYHVGNACMGINTSTTSSSYAAYVNGNLYATGDITAYSDRRKKTDIITIDNALDKVTKLRGVYYNKIDDLEKGRQTGVIAQEINEVLPEVVTYAADVDEYGVKYGNIVGVLIEAIKEQQKQIEELQNKLDNVLSNR